MKSTLTLVTAAAVMAWSTALLAQSAEEHQQHHQDDSVVQARTTPPQMPAPSSSQMQPQPPSQPRPQSSMGEMMQGMPEQCRTAMQSMPQGCMSMMHQMMQGRMRQGGMGEGGMMGNIMRGMMGGVPKRGGMMDSTGGMGSMGSMMRDMPCQSTTASAATKAYLDAVAKSHGPLLEGLQDNDPDLAFVRALIANKQSEIAIAKVRLEYGKDAQTKTWAENVIRGQEREIADLEAWLKKQAKSTDDSVK